MTINDIVYIHYIPDNFTKSSTKKTKIEEIVTYENGEGKIVTEYVLDDDCYTRVPLHEVFLSEQEAEEKLKEKLLKIATDFIENIK